MRQCSPPVMAGGSRPKRALTIRATWPAGTIGVGGATTAGVAAGAGAGATADGVWSCIGADGGASVGPGGGTGPTVFGGRGTVSKSGGVNCCAFASSDPDRIARPANRQAAVTRRGAFILPVIVENLANSS